MPAHQARRVPVLVQRAHKARHSDHVGARDRRHLLELRKRFLEIARRLARQEQQAIRVYRLVLLRDALDDHLRAFERQPTGLDHAQRGQRCMPIGPQLALFAPR